MTTNTRDCKIIPISLSSFKYTETIKLPLCSKDCDATDEASVDFPISVYDQGSSTARVSVVGYNMVHVVASDGRANTVSISAERIINCSNCAEGCDATTIRQDMGCIGTGKILATGDYDLFITPQVNWADEEIDELVVHIILEPITEEHVYTSLLNKK